MLNVIGPSQESIIIQSSMSLVGNKSATNVYIDGQDSCQNHPAKKLTHCYTLPQECMLRYNALHTASLQTKGGHGSAFKMAVLSPPKTVQREHSAVGGKTDKTSHFKVQLERTTDSGCITLTTLLPSMDIQWTV